MAIKWAPDFSTFSTDPNAIWRTTSDWETRTPVSGFYRPIKNLDPYGSSDPQYEAIQAPVNPARALLSAGAFNLSDPNLQRYFDRLAYTDFGGQPSADWRNNPAALATLLGRLGATTQQMTAAQRGFTGEVDPTSLFGGTLTPEQLQAAEASRKLQQHEANKTNSGGLSGITEAAGDWWSGANDFIVPAALTAIGMNYFGGAGAAGEAGASAGASAAGAELATPDWLSALLAETGEAGVGAGALESGFNAAAGLGAGGAEGSMFLDDAFSFDDPSFGGLIDDIDFGLEPLANGFGLSKVIDSIGGLLPKGLSGFMPSGNTLNTAAAITPILAAINYARNQGPFDTSRLVNTYDAFDPNALAFEYDQNTARGRNALTSSLAQRGVMGSSFGNMDLNNFQTTRDLGRRSLINQGLAQRGNIAATLLDAEAKARGLKNDLYGRSLLALGNVFGGRNQAPVYP